VNHGSLRTQLNPGQNVIAQAVARGPSPGCVIVGTTDTEIDFSQLATLGAIQITNLATANYVDFGPDDGDDLGAVITETSLTRILAAVDAAVADGQRLLAGGHRLTDAAHRDGFYVVPTVIEMVDPAHALTDDELFGPVAQLYRARSYHHALELANTSRYGLTAAIHTRDYGRAMHFTQHVSSGMAAVNAGTFGSEPHLPFGGRRQSGNGTREPGPEALDVYTSLKTIFLWADPVPLDPSTSDAGTS
jgi:aldehyde dehydrogenase (NAD+)